MIFRPGSSRFRLAHLCIPVCAIVFAVGCLGVTEEGSPPNSTFADSDPQCGHWAIVRCCEVLGVPAEMERVMALMPRREEGHSLLMLSDVLKAAGLTCKGRQETFDELRTGSFPVIAHLEPSHYVVVTRVNKTLISLYDGSGRRQIWPVEEFEKRWTHKILRVSRRSQETALPKWLETPDGPAPRIQFDSLIVDAGDVPSTGEPVAFTFPFKNLGTADLLVEHVQSSCNCIETSKPDQPVPPEATATITLKYWMREAAGPFSYAVLVQTNDAVVPKIQLTVAGNTNTTVTVKPARLDFGRLVAGRSRAKLCRLTNYSDIPMTIEGLDLTLEGVAGAHRVLRTDPEKWGSLGMKSIDSPRDKVLFLEIVLTPEPGFFGKADGVVHIHTNIQGFERMRVPVSVETIPRMAALPERIVLAAVRPGEDVRKTVTLLSNDESLFRVTSVDAGDTDLTCEFPAEETDKALLVFSGKVDNLDHLANKKILAHFAITDPPEVGTIELPIVVFPHPD